MFMRAVARRVARARPWLVAAAMLVTAGASAADRYWPPIVDPPTGHYTLGRFVWGELVTADVGTAADFYGKVFGWTFETYGGEDDRDTYTLALANGLPIGGMVYDARAMKSGTPSARWVGLVSVADVQAAATAATASGGTVIRAPVMLGERGETAILRDPEGALFGVVKSKHGDPLDYAGELNEWYWVDLWTSDVDKAAAFYRAVVGYETAPVAEDSLGTGLRLVSGGYARAGIMQKRNPETSTTWLPYLRVADVAATASATKTAGGKVLMEPVTLQGMRVAIIADPTGAPVGIVQVATTEAQP
jgi:hypothetical protein